MFGKFYFSIIFRVIQLFIWVFLFIIIVSPSSTLVAQDDVEEYWGDDEEYDEYEHMKNLIEEFILI